MSAARRAWEHVVIRASAGTGKTFQLSNRFIGLASGGEPLDSILATTFTRKAAGEILDRVLFRLAEAATEPGKLTKLAEQVEDPSLDRPRCLRLLQDMVRQLHRLHVGTLDSFFIQIARSFSLELSLPPGWQIVDEIVDRGLRAEAIRTVLQDESTRDVVRLMNLLSKGEASRSVSRQIASLVSDLYGLYMEAPPRAWQSLPRHKQLGPDQLQAALAALEAVELPEGKRFSDARDQNLQNARGEDWEAFLARGLAGKVFDGTGEFYRKPIPAEVVAAYEPLVRHAKAVLVGRIANQTEATRKLLERFDHAYQRLKLSRHALRFEDVTRKLSQAPIADRIDQVVYRLDSHVWHLLLDEFQDTSLLQWRVLRPFARRVVAREKVSGTFCAKHPKGRPGKRFLTPFPQSFFCVGDVKQAIYGWRGGVAEIFEALDEELPGLDRRSLNLSWRSSQAVIDTLNRVFENLAANTVLQSHSAAADRWSARFQRHTTVHADMPGHCRMIAAPRAGEDEDQGEITLRFAAERIARLHGQAPECTIGVLLRRNIAVARVIYELRSLGVDASEEGGNPLTDSPAVGLVMSILTLADHPGSAAARFHVANSPLAGQLNFTRHDDELGARQLAREIRQKLMTDGYGPTLYGWVKELSASCASRDLDRLVQLVGLAYGYESRASTRPDDFVNLVSQQKVEDPTSARVRVMTVHQAKGLQFDVVVLPELDVGLAGQPPQIVVGRPRPVADVQSVCRYVPKSLRPLVPMKFARMFDEHERQVVEEALCVLYVSLSRAVHALHMIVAPSRENEKTIRSTSAGLLRSALSDGHKADPGAVLYEHGDVDWFKAAQAKRPVAVAKPEPAELQRPLEVRLADAPQRPSRGLQRRSPSELEGGPRVNLAGRLRLDTTEALDRGSLVHAWFEQIEWLEDGLPEDDVLQQIAGRLELGDLDVPGLIGQFRAALEKPTIRAVLSRATYAQPAGDAAECAVHAGPDLSQPRWEVRREWPFAVRDGETILSGTIDRLVLLYDGDRPVAADVLDFKTDVVSADDPQAIAARVEEYRPQLAAYRRAVAALFHLAPARISARLVFVTPGEVRAV